MTRPSTQEMFAWANNPPEHQLVGFATSEEGLDDLRDEAVDGRRDFLYKAAK